MLKRTITEQELFKKVDDYNIFNHYFGEFDFNKSYPSVFRKDYNPSTGFYTTREGRIIYNDLSTDEKLGSINFVAKLFGLSYYSAIEKIAKDFGIIEGVDSSQRIKVKKYRKREKQHKVYEVTRGRWTKEELNYWKDYNISKKELEDNMIFPCRELKINGYIIENPKNYLRFCYIINGLDGNKYIKVYSPYDPVYKWVGSVPKVALFGLKELPFASKTLVITKGQKDRLLFKKFFTDVIATQSENKSAIPEDLCDLFNKEYSNIIINFDCDKAGIEGADYYVEKYGWTKLTVPEIYYKELGIKDFSDMVKIKGFITFKKYLKWLKLVI